MSIIDKLHVVDTNRMQQQQHACMHCIPLCVLRELNQWLCSQFTSIAEAHRERGERETKRTGTSVMASLKQLRSDVQWRTQVHNAI